MKNKMMLAFTALLLCGATRTLAQPVLAPGPFNPDAFWYSACTNSAIGHYISGINTAMIDFQTPISNSTLMVSAYEGNGTSGGVSFKDANSGWVVDIPYCPIVPPPPLPPPTIWPYITAPDIIVGNDATNPLTDYRVAVAYVDGFTSKPTVDYYHVSYFTPTMFTVTFLSSQTFPTLPGGSKNIHLDIVAEYNNTLATGYPWCNNFIVTWDDGGGSYASLQALNTLMPPSPITLSGILSPSQPDVAAIQRAAVWPCLGPCVPEIIGCFVTTENGQLYYQEYNFTTSIALLFATLGIPGAPNRPRIDAPDDLNNNYPTIPNLCYFKAVTEDYAGGTIRSLAYDNQPIIGPGINDGWYLPTMGGPGSGPYSPTVAYGGCGGTQYLVAHFVDAIAGSGGPTTNVYMEPLSNTWPASATAPDLTFGFPFYYRVNTATPAFCNGTYLNSISTPCNSPASKTLVAWADNDPLVPMANVRYKLTGCFPPIGYNFKQGNNGGNAPVPPKAWKLYPNPATTQLTIEAPEATTYSATDVLGRTVLSGTLSQGSQTITITDLLPGNYILTAQNSDGSKEHMSFVKQ